LIDRRVISGLVVVAVLESAAPLADQEWAVAAASPSAETAVMMPPGQDAADEEARDLLPGHPATPVAGQLQTFHIFRDVTSSAGWGAQIG
jgi:hypothetical protein